MTLTTAVYWEALGLQYDLPWRTVQWRRHRGPLGRGSSPWRDVCFSLRLLKRRLDKLRYLTRILLMPRLAERLLLRLPTPLGFLYYPLRPLRL